MRFSINIYKNNRGFLTVYFSILLCLAQTFLILEGVDYFGKYLNPILLFIVTVLFVLIYFHSLLATAKNINENISKKFKVFILAILAVISICIIVVLFNGLFHKVKNPVDFSDVIPQLEIQYIRFKNGEMPYKSIVLPHSKPFPVYMPFHWLPIYITDIW